MKANKFLKQLTAVFALSLVFTACVQDDDFDVPTIPPVQELGELASKGGNDDTFLSCLSEDFESYDDGLQEFTNYENIITFGSRFWESDSFGGNKFIKLSAFRADGDVYSYFAVPVDFDQADSFAFKTQDRYNNGDALKVLLVTNYVASQDIITDATMEDITSNFTIASGTTGGRSQPFVSSGSYDLSSATGKGYIVFKYAGSGDGITTTYHIDDITIVDNDDTNCSAGTPPATYETKGGATTTPIACLTEDFESLAEEAQEFAAYENISYVGGRFWEVDKYDNNNFVKLSAFRATGEIKSYLVIPVDFSAADKFSFKTQDRYNNGDVLKVFYTTDYTSGGDIEAATLTDITSSFTLASGTTGGASQPFVESGDYDLGSISGNGHIVFQYKGDGANSLTTTMHIDDIKIIDTDDSNCGGGTTGGNFEGRINEFHYDDEGADSNEFVEIRTTVDADVTNAKVELYNGNGGAVYKTETLANMTKTCDSDFCYYVWETSLQNGNDGIALSNGETLVEFISYEGGFTATNGAANGTNSTDLGEVKEQSAPEDSAIQRKDDGTWALTEGTNTKGAVNQFPSGGGSNTSDKLFISEYVEGSGSNKYIEIYNPSDVTVDLTKYILRNSRNTATDWDPTRQYVFAAGTTLAPNTTFVITNSDASDDIKNNADVVVDGSAANLTYYNGDDAVALFFDSNNDGDFDQLLDIIGEIDNDPGAGWDVAGVNAATKNHTLVRKASIAQGSTDWAASAGTTADDSQWIVNNQDDFSSIGQR